MALRCGLKITRHKTDANADVLLLRSSSEIPQFRLPFDVVSFEVELMKDLGVKVHVSSFLPLEIINA